MSKKVFVDTTLTASSGLWAVGVVTPHCPSLLSGFSICIHDSNNTEANVTTGLLHPFVFLCYFLCVKCFSLEVFALYLV